MAKCKSKLYKSAGLSAVLSAQGVSQVVDSFDVEPTKFRDGYAYQKVCVISR